MIMEIEKLVDYMLEGRQHKAELALKHWFETSEKYRTFIYKHRDKIRKKFRNSCTDEDLDDVRFELEIPYLFSLDENFVIKYEKFGSGKTRSPDFTIQRSSGSEFNVEAKRIRETILSTRYEEVIKQIIQPIRKTPSSFGFSLDVVDLEPCNDFISRLEDSVENVTKQILSLMAQEKLKMPYDTSTEYPIDGFLDELTVSLSKPSGKASFTKTSYYGGCCPIFYTNKEFRKLSDAIFEKLGQCISGMINVLAITTNSSTHEPEDVLEAIQSINELLNQGNDDFFKNKGLEGANEFLELSKALSGIVFKSTWVNNQKNYNLVWRNANADHKISEDLMKYMKNMGHNL